MDRSTDVVKADEAHTPFLPQIRSRRTEHRDSPTQSPSSSPKVPRLPPIQARKGILNNGKGSYGAVCLTRFDLPSPDRVRCAECSNETSMDTEMAPIRTAQTVQSKSKQENMSPGEFTSKCAPHKALSRDPAEPGSGLTSLPKPRFGRRSVAQRITSYQSRSTDETLDSEMLAIEEKNPHIFAASDDVPPKLEDLNGKRLGSSSVYREDITSVLGQRGSEELVQLAKRKTTEVRTRFLDALDQHYMNNFRASDPGRRMAICDEIEHTVRVGNLTLARYREHLRVQVALNDWL